MRKTTARQGGGRFTIVELLVVISIMSILTCILLPGLRMARETAKGIGCKSQMKQVGQYFLLYSSDYSDYLPYCPNNALDSSYCMADNLLAARQYIGRKAAYIPASRPSLYRCPSYDKDNTFFYIGYGYNIKFYFDGARKITGVPAPSKSMLLLEKGWDSAQTSNYPWYAVHLTPGTANYLGSSLGKRHNGWGGVFYVDNHVGDWKSSLPGLTDSFWTGK